MIIFKSKVTTDTIQYPKQTQKQKNGNIQLLLKYWKRYKN